jgi:hypothetical protein
MNWPGDGTTRISSGSTVADYVGTSREIVSSEFNRLRRLGCCANFAKHTDIYTSAIQEVLWQRGDVIPHARRILALTGG